MIVDLIAHLTAEVTAVSGRVYPLLMPQDTLKPAIVVTVITDIDLQSLNNPLPYGSELRIQLDCYAESYKDVKALLGAVKTAMYSFTYYPHGFNSRDVYEKDTKLHRQLIEFYFKG